jgi:hypothetical protein
MQHERCALFVGQERTRWLLPRGSECTHVAVDRGKVTEIGRGDRAAGRAFHRHMQVGIYFRLLPEALTLAIHEALNLR